GHSAFCGCPPPFLFYFLASFFGRAARGRRLRPQSLLVYVSAPRCLRLRSQSLLVYVSASR
ncbi:MAG: hypothetical protein AAF515_03830, partial [Pseudomonadota bacterium]